MSAPPTKYHSQRVECGDHSHPSKRERHDCWVAQQREARGEIRHLRRQTRWPLDVNGVRIGSYTSDLDYEERQPDGSWQFVIQDSKGVATREYRRTKRHMQAQYGFTIRET